MPFNSLAKNFVSLLTIKGVDFLVPLVIFPILINRLGIEEFGVISLGFAFSMYLSAIFQYGNNLIAVRKVATIKEKSDMSAYISSVFSALFFTVLLFGILFLLILKLSFATKYIELLTFAFILSLTESILPSWLYQGKEEMKPLGVVGSVSKVCLVFYLAFYLPEESGFQDVFLGFIISSFISAFLLICYARHKSWFVFELPDFNDVLKYYRDGFHSFLIQFAPTLYTSSVILVLSFYASNTVVGQFSAAQKFINISLSLLFISFNVIYPFIVKNKKKLNKLSHLYVITSFVLMFASVLLLPNLLSLIIKTNIESISTFLIYLSPMIFFFGIRIGYGQLYYLITNKEIVYSRLIVVVSLLGFVFSWFVIKKYNVYGAIAIMNLVNFAMAISILYLRKKEGRFNENCTVR